MLYLWPINLHHLSVLLEDNGSLFQGSYWHCTDTADGMCVSQWGHVCLSISQIHVLALNIFFFFYFGCHLNLKSPWIHIRQAADPWEIGRNMRLQFYYSCQKRQPISYIFLRKRLLIEDGSWSNQIFYWRIVFMSFTEILLLKTSTVGTVSFSRKNSQLSSAKQISRLTPVYMS